MQNPTKSLHRSLVAPFTERGMPQNIPFSQTCHVFDNPTTTAAKTTDKNQNPNPDVTTSSSSTYFPAAWAHIKNSASNYNDAQTESETEP